MGKAGSGNDLSYFRKERVIELWMLFDKITGHIVAKRHSYTRYLKGVCKAVVHKNTARKWEYLSLVLETTERGGEDKTVIVSFKFRSVVMTLGMSVLLPKAFV